MSRWFRRAVVPLGALALVVLPLGCLVPNVRTDTPASPRAGVDAYRLIVDEARSLAGCRYGYRVYEPLPTTSRPGTASTPGQIGPDASRPDAPGAGGHGSAPKVTVALGHGFLRDQNTLVELSRALANAGHRAVTLDFCNMRPWNGHHLRNGADLRALAGRVADGPVVYAGFSAGALAALLAASEGTSTNATSTDGDVPPTLGVITLDLVDQADLAVNALGGLDVPLVGLQGPPSGCNASGNGRTVFQRYPRSRLDTLPGASHCEFESPTNALCEIFCGDEDDDDEDERTRTLIVEHVVEAVDQLARDHDSAHPAPSTAGAARM